MTKFGIWKFSCGCSDGNGPRVKHEHTYQWAECAPIDWENAKKDPGNRVSDIPAEDRNFDFGYGPGVHDPESSFYVNPNAEPLPQGHDGEVIELIGRARRLWEYGQAWADRGMQYKYSFLQEDSKGNEVLYCCTLESEMTIDDYVEKYGRLPQFVTTRDN